MLTEQQKSQRESEKILHTIADNINKLVKIEVAKILINNTGQFKDEEQSKFNKIMKILQERK